jgi:hypothetical protein
MPKAARRQSAPKSANRAEPYPVITPGDKPTSAEAKKASPKALAEKTDVELNTASIVSSGGKKATEKPSPQSATNSFLDIKLDGELENRIPIFDTCSVIRGKINLLLGKDNAKPENGIPGEFKKDGTPKPYTKARFVADIGEGTTRSLDTFMKAKKIMGGAESVIYPAAYKFFEKKRIFEKKAKSAGRKNTEDE